MSAPKVDVLAWFDDYIRRCGIYDDGTPIRAAVAKLIEAANRAAIAACRGDESHPATMRNADLDALRAALARIGSDA